MIESNFEQYEGGIEVRDRAGGIHPVPTPVGFSDVVFRNAVATVSTFWNRFGKLPSVTECVALHRAIPLATYSALFLTPEFAQALAYRGIVLDEKAGLSLEQQMLLTKLSDPTDRRSLSVKLREFNIPMPRYQAWLRHPLFKEHLTKITKDAYTDYLPNVRMKLIGNAEAGDQRAIELLFAMTGEWDPAARGLQDARQVVMTVIDSVVKNVSDPDVRAAILSDVQAAIVTFDATNQRALGS